MKRFLVLFLIICIFLTLGLDVAYAQRARGVSSYGIVPKVRLISPTPEVYDMAGEKGILFKWSPHKRPSGGRRKFRFQLYDDYEMYEKNLIFKKEIDPNTYEIFIPEDKFEDGGVYTWSVRQRSNSSVWSERSFHSFKVTR